MKKNQFAEPISSIPMDGHLMARTSIESASVSVPGASALSSNHRENEQPIESTFVQVRVPGASAL